MKNLLSNDRGFSLVIVMGVLTAFIILAAGLTLTSTTDVRIASTQRRSTQALATAEAGINEVIQRMMLPRTNTLAIADTTDTLRTGWRVAVLLSNSPPDPSGDTSYTSSVQVDSVPSADWLNYTTSSDGSEALSIRHKTNLAGTEIYFYDTNSRVQFSAPPSYDGPFYPVEVIEATGRDGKAKRHIIAEVCRAPILPLVTSSFTSDIKLKLQGAVNFCGHNHVANTPSGTTPPACSLWHVTRADTPLLHPMPCPVVDAKCSACGCIPGVLTTGDSIKITGAAVTYGNPDTSSDSTNPFYEIWEVLGYDTEADMNAAINWKSSTNPVDGFTKVEGNLHLTTGDEKGVLWVRGDLFISGNYKFRGIIYVDNDFRLTGTSWTLGSIIIKGEFLTELAPGPGGTATVLYSSRGIQDIILESLGGFTILAWREKY